MAQDIRDLFNTEEKHVAKEVMSQGHEARFLEKLNETFPETISKKSKFNWWSVAASLVLLFALSIGGYNYFTSTITVIENAPKVSEIETTPEVKTKSLGDLSPDFKKIEDYYLASIHAELAKVELTTENKELIDGYILRLEELSNEYKTLSVDLTKNGPNELTINALIDNLKLRLNLLYRLRDQLQDLETDTVGNSGAKQSI